MATEGGDGMRELEVKIAKELSGNVSMGIDEGIHPDDVLAIYSSSIGAAMSAIHPKKSVSQVKRICNDWVESGFLGACMVDLTDGDIE
jgi:hypothetical protein